MASAIIAHSIQEHKQIIRDAVPIFVMRIKSTISLVNAKTAPNIQEPKSIKQTTKGTSVVQTNAKVNKCS